MARFFFGVLLVIWSTCSVSNAAESPALSPRGVARLMTAAEKNARNAQSWADDLLDVLKLHDLTASKENICAAIAIIDQDQEQDDNPHFR